MSRIDASPHDKTRVHQLSIMGPSVEIPVQQSPIMAVKNGVQIENAEPRVSYATLPTEIQIMIYKWTNRMIEKDQWNEYYAWSALESRRRRENKPLTDEEKAKKPKSPWSNKKKILTLRLVNKLWCDLGAEEIYQAFGYMRSSTDRRLSASKWAEVCIFSNRCAVARHTDFKLVAELIYNKSIVAHPAEGLGNKPFCTENSRRRSKDMAQGHFTA